MVSVIWIHFPTRQPSSRPLNTLRAVVRESYFLSSLGRSICTHRPFRRIFFPPTSFTNIMGNRGLLLVFVEKVLIRLLTRRSAAWKDEQRWMYPDSGMVTLRPFRMMVTEPALHWLKKGWRFLGEVATGSHDQATLSQPRLLGLRLLRLWTARMLAWRLAVAGSNRVTLIRCLANHVRAWAAVQRALLNRKA